MADRVAGKVFLKIGDEQLSLESSISLGMSNLEKETISGVNGPEGFIERGKVPFMEVTAFHKPDFPEQYLEDLNGQTVTAELANGKTAVLYDAYMVGGLEIDAVAGTVTVRLEGSEGKWI